MILALLLQAAMPAAPAPVPTVAPAGEEMVALFTSLCVEAALNPASARQLLNGHPDSARSMTADELARAVPSAVATEGWITKSPHGSWGALWFAPAKRTCGVTVRAAEPAGMEAALGARLQHFYTAMGAPVTQRPDETVVENNVTVHRAGWTIALGTHEAAVIASFGDQPTGATQHLMTFTLLH